MTNQTEPLPTDGVQFPPRLPSSDGVETDRPPWHEPYPIEPRETSGDGSGSLRPVVFYEDAATIQQACALIAKLLANRAVCRSHHDEAMAFLRRHGDRTIQIILDDSKP